MAKHEIEVKVEATDKEAKEAGSELRALAGVAARLSPEMRALTGTFRSLLRVSEVFGTNIGMLAGAGGVVAAAISIFKQLNEAAEQAAEQL